MKRLDYISWDEYFMGVSLLAAKRNVLHGTERIRREFQEHPEMRDVAIKGAVYDIGTGAVEWL